jgi:hypothetical protein
MKTKIDYDGEEDHTWTISNIDKSTMELLMKSLEVAAEVNRDAQVLFEDWQRIVRYLDGDDDE